MNIYAIRDRMLDYFQDPFVAPNDYNVLASVANVINNQEVQSAIAQAPHHFEIWRIATVNDQGQIRESREFIADCSSLIRQAAPDTGRTAAHSAARPAPPAAPQQTRSLGSSQPGHAAQEQAASNPLAPAGSEAAQGAPTPRGGSN